MAELEIIYKGSSIAIMNASGTTTLETAGTYCEDNIEIEYSRPDLVNISSPSWYLDGDNILVSVPALQAKVATPSESAQTIMADSGYDGLSQVLVNAISSSFVGSQVPRLSANTITPTATDQTIASGQYLSGAQTIKGDENLTANNIAQGVTIFGITGTHVSNPTVITASSWYLDSDDILIMET